MSRRHARISWLHRQAGGRLACLVRHENRARSPRNFALKALARLQTGSVLRRGMRYPATWDPFFVGYMTLADIYRYPTQHFRFHQRQLTLSPPREQSESPRGMRLGH